MWRRIDASPEYRAVVAAGYRPTPSPVPHTADDLARHPWILLDIAHHDGVLYDPESIHTAATPSTSIKKSGWNRLLTTIKVLAGSSP